MSYSGDKVYCEHKFTDLSEYDSVEPGQFYLKRNTYDDEYITEDNYNPDNPQDPILNQLQDKGRIKANAYTCPICSIMREDPNVYFVEGQEFTEMYQTNVSFVRLRMDLNPKRFRRDPTTEILSEKSLESVYSSTL